MKSNERGITLIALVITVIILVILAAVAMSAITGNDGLFSKANESATLYNEKAKEEADILNGLLDLIEIDSNVDVELIDVNGTYAIIKFDGSKITSDMEKFEIFLNGQKIAETDTDTYTITGLSEGTTYKVMMVAKDANGKVLSKTMNKNLETPNKLYLYREGNLCSEASGGWTVIKNTGNLDLNSNEYMSIVASTSSNTSKYHCTAMTTDKIDVSGYSKVCFEFEVANEVWVSPYYRCYLDLMLSEVAYVNYDSWNNAYVADWNTNTDAIAGTRVTKTIDIPENSPESYVIVAFEKWTQMNAYGINAKIYNVWLEK